MSIEQRRWLVTIIGVITIFFGVLAVGKPYWTLETTSVWLTLVVLVLVLWRGSVLHRSAIGVVALAVAIALVISRDFAVALLVYGVLAYLVLAGIYELRQIRERRWFAAAFGISMLLLGLLGIFWVDVASILIGLLIAPILIIAGSMMVIRSWRSNEFSREPKHHGKLAIVLGRTGSVLLLLLALATTIATGRAMFGAPELDGFGDYDWPTNPEPGVLVRAARFNRGMPDGSIATRILYTTTGLDGENTLATALVIVPETVPDDPLPVILWAHGTTGVAVTCAPTLLSDPLGSGAMMFPDLPLEQGWAIIAPDYLGLGASAPHPYLVGVPTAQSSLDAVRAARQLDAISLSDETVVWGHSQGGGGALWIGIEAPDYAPDVPLLGVAAMSPASDLPSFVDTLLSGPAGPIFGGYVIRAFADTYDDVDADQYIRPGAKFSQEKLVERCISEPSFIANILSAVISEPFTRENVYEGPIHARLQENVPSQALGVPLFLGQGEADTLIMPDVQANFVSDLCTAGQVVEYHIYTGRDHLSVVDTDSPMLSDLMTWTEARFAGDPPAESCTTTPN